MQNSTDFFTNTQSVLDVGPAPGFARALSGHDDFHYVTVGIDTDTPHLSVIGDVRALPFADGTFQIVLCQHVLEHVDDDRRSLAEIRRVTNNGGWAIISVPILLDKTTHEDPSITDPRQREKFFGEAGHVRMYGYDLAERLEAAGFAWSLQNAEDIPSDECARYGLRRDEQLFICHPSG